jgi:protein phosphatase
MTIQIPALSLVLLVGPSGSGKSTFAARHFKRTEVVSSDFCRGLVSDDENDQSASEEAFALLRVIAGTRLRRGLLTVVDATNVRPEDRNVLIALAREHHVLPVAIVFDLPSALCQARNDARPDRQLPPHVVRNQSSVLRRSLKGMRREGFASVSVLEATEDVDAAVIERTKLFSDRRDEPGPFDIIGDVHGCLAELEDLLRALGYHVDDLGARHPEGRRAVFVGDLVDRGPDSAGVLRLALQMHAAGSGIFVPGNHDVKLQRKLAGREVQVSHGLAETLAQLEGESPAFREQVASFIFGMVSHYVFDAGRLVVAHAGLPETLQGRSSAKVRDFALYGETTGETDEFGLQKRYEWARDYRGAALVVYGHTPALEPAWSNNTICIDTG